MKELAMHVSMESSFNILATSASGIYVQEICIQIGDLNIQFLSLIKKNISDQWKDFYYIQTNEDVRKTGNFSTIWL